MSVNPNDNMSIALGSRKVKNRLRRWSYRIISQPVSIYPLVTLRILFGLLIMFSTARFVALGWIEDHYVNPIFHFKYYGFEWVAPLNLEGLYAVHFLLFAAALAFMLGYRYRLSAMVLFLTFTYTELIDLTYYLNHYYFVSLVSMLFIFLPAHRAMSLDVSSSRVRFCQQVSAWTINCLKLMVAIVYLYAGLAKMNETWLLEALPLKIWLPAHDTLPLIGSWLTIPATAYVFSWLGMLFDTTIVFFLIHRPTRIAAFLAVVAFHTFTGLLFQIGVFPLVMIAMVLVFFSEDWHRGILTSVASLFNKKYVSYYSSIISNQSSNNKLSEETDSDTLAYQTGKTREKVLLGFLSVFFLFQLLFPWRYLLYDSNVFWSEEGYRFSWRVMLMEKAGSATFFVRDGQTGREGVVINSDFLNAHQEKQMAMQPDMILQYAHFLGEHFQKKGVRNPEVRAEVYVTLNGKPSRLFVDNQLNLLTLEENWVKRSWIVE